MKTNKVYVCSQCGAKTFAWAGKCSSCGTWGSIEEVEEVKKKVNDKKQDKASKLKEIKVENSSIIKSGISEFDRVIGKGLVKDSVTILTAKPGCGKSTLLLQLSKEYAESGLKVLYASGEESQGQIKSRAERVMENIPENIWLISTNSMDSVIDTVKELKPDIIFLDSIQTFTLQEFSSRAASPTQTVECTQALIDIAKNSDHKAAVIMIGHMTKQDEMAGLRTLEHMVDTVMVMDSEMDEDLRILTSTKNRFGRTGEIGIFKMQEDGIKEVKDPQNEFITKRSENPVGASITFVKEGSRYIAVEIESLVSCSYQSYPSRIGECIKKDKLEIIIAILEVRCGLKLYDKNVVVKTTGGLKLTNQDSDLALAVSIFSSLKNIPIENKSVFLAEVGLTGELKQVKNIENRIQEIKRLGYTKVYVGGHGNFSKYNDKKFMVINKTHLYDIIRELSSKD